MIKIISCTPFKYQRSTTKTNNPFDGFFTRKDEQPHVIFMLQFHAFRAKQVVFGPFASTSRMADDNDEDDFFVELSGSDDGVNWSVIARKLCRLEKEVDVGDIKANFVNIDESAQDFYRYFRLTKQSLISIQKESLKIQIFEMYGDIIFDDNTKIRLLQYKSDFDENGAIFYLGSNEKKNPWTNPSLSKIVKVTSTGSSKCDINRFTGRVPSRCVTTPKEKSWISVDFGNNVSILPSHYTLRHYDAFDTEALRNWVLQGSNDNRMWKVLLVHEEDASLNKAGQTHTWAIPFQQEFFSKFRIFQTGKNSNKHFYLAASGFEIYGAMKILGDFFENINVTAVEKIERRDFGKDGILFYLGSHGNSTEWINPVERGYIEVSQSSLAQDSLSFKNICGREIIRCVTLNEESAWFALSFTNCRIKPSKYSLRHYSTYHTEALRNWCLQGSEDGQTWITLRKHVEDKKLFRPGDTNTWKCHSTRFYPKFRLILTGKNSTNNYILACSGIEFYGSIQFNSSNPFQKSIGIKSENKISDPKKRTGIYKNNHSEDTKIAQINRNGFKQNQNWDFDRHSNLVQIDNEFAAINVGVDDLWEV
ncbi:E3 ubiquitin-protein ligase HTD1 [Bonamia ostreae]|uniref:E3 ubiquitin-protein ligase HTD1 n=1 Tax=Bonamia ostreae TaxID=126728 RepID=A0ABV2AJZ1_9EUKA